MTPNELANEAIRGILEDSGGNSQLRTFAPPRLWITSSVDGDSLDFALRNKTVVEDAGDLLVEWKVLKPDNRNHKGIGKAGNGYYRLSRGWWNRNHPKD